MEPFHDRQFYLFAVGPGGRGRRVHDGAGGHQTARAGQVVEESAREIPVAYRVDVVVVGGTTQAVEAAAAAAKAGASVFLAAPRNSLGDDLCGTLRLWLEDGQEPATELGRTLFAKAARTSPGAPPIVNGAAFTYTTDLAAVGSHKDTKRPSVLTDGRCNSAVADSVQYDGDVTITCDLGKTQPVRRAALLAYQRAGDFVVKDVTVSVSTDGKTWTNAATLANPSGGKGEFEDKPVSLAGKVAAEARYVRLAVRKADDASRVLLAEVQIDAGDDAKADNPEPATQPAVRLTTPMHVKLALDDALLTASVKYLYGCYPTDVLRDADGQVAGIVMANRAGRQAVIAKVVIDATGRAAVARMAGAKFRPCPAGERTFKQVVIGGEPISAPGLAARVIGDYPLVKISRGGEVGAATGNSAKLIEYTMQLPVADGSFAAAAAANQAARDRTWTPEALRVSDQLFEVPPDAMVSRKPLPGPWPGDDKADLGAFMPEGVERMYVIDGCADVPRDVAAKLLRPTGLMGVAARIGQAAATLAKSLPAVAGAGLPGSSVRPDADGEVREVLTGVRPTQQLATVPSGKRPLDVLGRYDVVVIGGGTGGAGGDRGRPQGRTGAGRRIPVRARRGRHAGADRQVLPRVSRRLHSRDGQGHRRTRRRQGQGQPGRMEDGVLSSRDPQGRRRDLVRHDRLRGLRSRQAGLRRGGGHAGRPRRGAGRRGHRRDGQRGRGGIGRGEVPRHGRGASWRFRARACRRVRWAPSTPTRTTPSPTSRTWWTIGGCSSRPSGSSPRPSTWAR